MAETTSQSLLEELRSPKSEGSWDRFARIYCPFVESILRKAGLDEHDAADVGQDVMEVLIRELPTFRHNGHIGAFRRWLRNVTGNRLRTFRRFRKRDGHLKLVSAADLLEDPNSELSAAWNQEHDRYVINGLLEEIAAKFTPYTLIAFRRTFLDGDAISDVADELRMSKNAVVVARSKVLQELRRLGEGLLD